MRSASIAVRAIMLYEKVSRQQELYRKILVFQYVCHDHQLVLLSGHYADVIELQFFRHYIRFFTFNDKESGWTGYNFTRKVYEDLAPIHRIRSALSKLADRPRESMYISSQPQRYS